MAGWGFTIVRQTPEEYSERPARETVLASWMVGVGGIRWIEELVDRGEAECVKIGGYPNLYTAPARTIAAALASGEPPSDTTVRMFMPREVSIDRAELDACPPDQALTVAVWDQS